MMNPLPNKITGASAARIVLLACITILGAGCRASTNEEDAPTHVIVIVIDALRVDHLGCYGYERNTTPFIDSLAREGVLFERAYSQSSYTAESVASLFMGQYPSRNPWSAGWYARPDPDKVGLPALFGQADFRTGMFNNSPVLHQEDYFAPFDEYECLMHEYGVSLQGPRLSERALRFIAENKTRDTFMYLHYFDPHSPYEPPPDYYRRFAPEIYPEPLRLFEDVRPNLTALVADGFGPGDPRFEDLVLRYDGEIAFEDNSIRMLVEGLRDMGVLKDTLIVLTADHGEEFLDHGFVEHAWTLYPESIHVPLLFWSPDRFVPGRVDDPVALVDILPTLAILTDLALPKHTLDGAPLFEREGETWHPSVLSKPIISEMLIPMRNMVRSVVYEGYMYKAASQWMSPEECSETARHLRQLRTDHLSGAIPAPEPWAPPVFEALFNLEKDPRAMDNLMDQEPDRVREMRRILEEYRRQCPPQKTDPLKASRGPGLLTAELLQILENLGYVAEAPETGESEDAPADMTPEEREELMRGIGYL